MNASTALLNGAETPFDPGDTLYQWISRNLGDDAVPVLCHDPALKPFGACRMCLVEVATKADGPTRLMAACHTPVTAGLSVVSHSDRIHRVRKNILELLASQFPAKRMTPEQNEQETPFQRLLREYGVHGSRYPSGRERGRKQEQHPYIRFDPSECIHCYRCVRACDEIQGEFILAMQGRGIDSHIIQGAQTDFSGAGCVSCGRCVQTCPTNALHDRYRAKTRKSENITRTICTYCGVGCNLEVKVENGRVVAISGAEDAPASHGHTCLKGRYAFEFVHSPDRLRTPLIRKNGELTECGWDEALDFIADRLNAIRDQHGPDAIAGISSARCTNEENYLMQKFMRAVIGSNNIDGCARVCHAPTAWGMQQTLGTGAATNSVAEIPLADCLMLVGANPTEAHPVTGAAIRQAALKGAPLIVIDPIRTRLAKIATVHLPVKPGGNIPLLTMFIHGLLQQELIDPDFIRQRTEGFHEFVQGIQTRQIPRLEELADVGYAQVSEAVALYGNARNAMMFHGLGVTEHYQGSRTVMLLADIAMMTGNIGRPGTGVNPLRGQNNVQGAADMGVQPHQGAGYLDVASEANQALYEQHYGRPMPTTPGLKIPEMLGAARQGQVRALWIMGEDILQTDPNTCEVRSALASLELLIVQELFMTETCAMADVVLPAASFLEKSGTFTNSDRRIQKVNAAIAPLPGVRPDGEIVCDIMNRMGYPQKPYDADSVLDEISRIVPFFKGVTRERLGNHGLQWPVDEQGHDTQVLHTDRFRLVGGKGRFIFPEYETSPELRRINEEYPYILTTGRLLEHYNCGSMTRRTPNLQLMDHDQLLVNPADAEREGLTDGGHAEICSANGATHLKVKLTEDIRPGVLYTTFHFPEIAINHLTSNVFEQTTMTPEYKVVAVNIRPFVPGKDTPTAVTNAAACPVPS